MRAPNEIHTERLTLRKPEAHDAEAVFERYAGDARVGNYLAWPIHKTVDDTRLFLNFSDAQWAEWPAGPYLVFRDGELIGSTGLAFETGTRASTGYVFAVDAWGKGYATEAGAAAMDWCFEELGREKVSSVIRPGNERSIRVAEKLGVGVDQIRRQRWTQKAGRLAKKRS